VNRVGDELLYLCRSRPDQDVRVARRHALDQLEEVFHLLALTNDVGEAVLAANLFLELLMLGALLCRSTALRSMSSRPSWLTGFSRK
jgi:hypothetical protein